MYKGFDLSGKVAALTGSTAGMGFAIARGLAQCGAKIVISSHTTMLGAYGAGKAALNGIVRSMAVEWGASNIRANAIAPSFVRTAFSKDFWSDPEREKAAAARTPAGRIAEAEEVVGAAILLASPAGAYISGQVLLIDGARSIT